MLQADVIADIINIFATCTCIRWLVYECCLPRFNGFRKRHWQMSNVSLSQTLIVWHDDNDNGNNNDNNNSNLITVLIIPIIMMMMMMCRRRRGGEEEEEKDAGQWWHTQAFQTAYWNSAEIYVWSRTSGENFINTCQDNSTLVCNHFKLSCFSIKYSQGDKMRLWSQILNVP